MFELLIHLDTVESLLIYFKISYLNLDFNPKTNEMKPQRLKLHLKMWTYFTH